MPRGSGIYEDEPREHRQAHSSESADQEPGSSEDSTPDDLGSKGSGEPPD